MNSSEIYSILSNTFPLKPTLKQIDWFKSIADFLDSPLKENVFLLKGYAGTGKSTLIGHLVQHLQKFSFKSVLIAPTGRAAKVISNYSNRSAFTIHKQIYYPKSEKGSGVKFILKANKHKNTLFIVDEASMIGDDRQNSKFFENGSLLNDLIQYVSTGNSCFLILVGDTAQLPPVNLEISPALSREELEDNYNKKVTAITLTEVVRQLSDSGILYNATVLREFIFQEVFNKFRFELNSFDDIQRIQDGEELLNILDNSFNEYGIDQVVFIVRSNKRANLYNQNIRKRILFLESSLSVGDQLMVVKNNYFWIKPESQAGFIANGDIIVVEKINNIKEFYGFKFAEITAKLVDYPEMPSFETVVLTDTLTSNTPSLNYEESQSLYKSVQEDYKNEKSSYKKFLKVKNNPYFNALQVKYSYSITCHKSQGGQWDRVFVEYPYLPDGPNKDFFRWLYTAITRAKKGLYLVGFPKEYFN
ncbi:MAG: exodeoxyribonuclease-5 [Candidatus Marivariicella framensis]|jgi:exodeoxyribonuclease-5|tara:strand:- start:490 stop:1911 length:1422 start_codon:yes stop_codon:yes gene_type:complete